METVVEDEVRESLRALVFEYLYNRYRESVTIEKIADIYEQVGIRIDLDEEKENPAYNELAQYRNYLTRCVEAEVFPSNTIAKDFFEREWLPVMVGGKPAILKKHSVDSDEPLEMYAKSSWAEMFNTRKLIGESWKPKSAARWWMDSVDYHPTVFDPNPAYCTSNGEVNLFTGFRYRAESNGKAERYLSLLREGICGGSEAYYEYLLDWMAQLIQSPHRKDACGIAVSVKGEPGVGKSTFAKVFAHLLGRHSHTCNSVESVVGNFNGVLYEKLLVVGEESLWGGDKKQYNALKQLITDNVMEIGFKFREPFQAKNYLRFIFLTNSDWSAPNEAGDRRFFNLEASDAFKKDTGFFRKLWEDMRNGGYNDLMQILSTRDISKRDFQKDLPMTEASLENIERSLSSVASVVQEWIEYGILCNDTKLEWGCEHPKKLIYDIYLRRAKELNLYVSRDSVFGRELKKILPSVVMRQDSDITRTKMYALPDRFTAEAEFERYKRKQ